jgi:Ca2+-binding RTX toxin-like protein
MTGDNAIIVRVLSSGQWLPNIYNAGLQHEIVILLDVDEDYATVVSGPDKMDGDGEDDVMYGQANGPSGVVLPDPADTCDLSDSDTDGTIDEDLLGDCMSGGLGEDYMEGNAGGDTLFGHAGQDDMLGGTGRINADQPTGTEGRKDGPDWMYGEFGTAEGATDGSGADVMLGDNGLISRPLDDTNHWIENPFNQTWLRNIRLLDIETLTDPVPATAYDGDRMWGNDNDDLMWGQGGEDEMYGGAGDDYMEGNNHSDLMHGNSDQDDMLGGTGPTVSGDPLSAIPGRLDISTQMRAVPMGTVTPTVPLGDTMYGDGAADVMLGDNGLVTRPLDGDLWTWLNYHLAMDTEGDVSPHHELSGIASSRVDRLIQNLDVDNDDTAGSDLMFGGSGDDDMYGQFDDTNGPVQPAIGDELFGETGEDAMLGDNGTVTSSVLTEPTGYIAPNEPFIDDQVYLQGSLFRTVTLEQIPAGGNDRMSGGDQGDWMHGGAGDDLMNGNNGADRLFGDDGKDVMWGGLHHDHLWGGYQNDYLDVRPRPAMTIGGKKPVIFPADPLEWFAYAENEHYQGIDYIYGGWHQDAMQANVADEGPTIGDRLLDWVGAYNAYYLCPGLYGEYVNTRDLSPAIQAFLQQLSAADGARTPATTGTSGFNELGLVYTKDIKYNQRPVHYDNPGHFTCEFATPATLAMASEILLYLPVVSR